jgi:hypothetical protein
MLARIFPRSLWHFLGSEAAVEGAVRSLWDGWHLLCEANLALFEAEACRIWYEEFRNPPSQTLAIYHSRYYLDDAALRIHASAEHMLKALKAHLGLKIPKMARDEPKLRRMIHALKQGDSKSRIAKWLERWDSNQAWWKCAEYRNRWVHNNRMTVRGLASNLTSAKLHRESGIEGFSFGRVPLVELNVGELSQWCRGAYLALLDVYLRVFKLVSPKPRELRFLKSDVYW